MTSSSPRNALSLAIILGCYLMIILDISVVITALPSIHEDLGFSTTSLSWVQNAYTLTFGGLLLLGARAGDILGRRRVFIAGIALFTFASMLGGVAQSPAWLLGARAVQGVGAAIAAPSTLALLTISFPEGPERTRAVAWYSAVAGAGGSIGLLLGGMLTSWISWRCGLFINVPIGAVLIWLAPRQLPETERRRGRFDLAGAISSTVGMTALVFGLVRAAEDGWGDPLALASFAAAAALLAYFVANERRADQPITPLRLFTSRERVGAYVARILVVGAMYSTFFFLTQYLQVVQGYGALAAGSAFLPMTLSVFAMVRVVPRIAPRVGEVRILAVGLALALAGMLWLGQISPGADYLTQMAAPLILLGVGLGSALTPLTTAGMAGVADADAGAASGLINVSHQLGGTLGVGALVTVFAAASSGAGAHALVEGVPTVLAGAAILIVLSLTTVLAVMRPRLLPARAGRAEVAA
ncbi:MAG TPA: MFS transporter [Solirubrobacterales bacterium]|jgi:EmrB/QacA subfamily drug resistance transporter